MNEQYTQRCVYDPLGGNFQRSPYPIVGQGGGTGDKGGEKGKGKEGTEEEVKRRGREKGKEGERDKEGRNPPSCSF